MLLLYNAFIYTGDVGHSCIPNGWMLIDGARIVRMGPASNAPQMIAQRRVDLGGRVVMPGMINTHAHGGLSLQRGCCDDGDLFQWAGKLAPYTSNLSIEDNRWGCYLAIMEMVRNGITNACDCTRYGAGIFSQVAAEIGMRSLGGALANSPVLRPNGRPNWPRALEETQDAIAASGDNPLCRFYLGAHSPYSCEPELMQEVKQKARELGLPFAIHLAENRAEVALTKERYGKRPVELLHHLGILDSQTILAHCVWVDPDEMDMLAENGAGVAHNPISNGKLASGVAPVPEFRKRGVPVGLGTDSTLSNNSLNLFQEMKFAVLMQRNHHLDGYAMNARDALSMATREGARVLGWEAETGSLEVGKQADLVVLDIDHPLGLTPERVISDLVYAAGPQHIQSVMVAGETIFENGRFTRIDEAAIRRQVRRIYCEG